MKYLNELEKSLSQYFSWHKARTKCLARTLLALIKVRTVNLSQLATAFSSKAKLDSRNKRLKRFFSTLFIDKDIVAKCIFNSFFPNGEKVYLILDRTNWYHGKKKLNVLMLSAAYEGIAIPLYWIWLNKGGNSRYDERIFLIKKFIETFGKERIEGLLGDREFVGINWIPWLADKKIPFYFRIKNGSKVKICNGKAFSVEKIFSNLKLKENKNYINYLEIFGQKNLRVGAGRSERGELLTIVTNMDPKNAVPIYLRRWEIENLFKALKSGGFNFEDTKITNLDRIDNLLAVVSLAFCWVHKIGEWRDGIVPIKFKIYRNKLRYLEKTYFRYGLDWLRDLVFDFKSKFDQFKKCLYLFFKPTKPLEIQEEA